MANDFADQLLRQRIDDTLTLYRLRSLTTALRHLRRWFRRTAWVRTTVVLAAIVGTALVIQRLTSGGWGWPSWATLGITVVVLLAVGLLFAATAAQKRIVIESFADHLHAADAVDPSAAGLPALVRQELNRLRQLYDPPTRRSGLDVVGLGVDHVGGRSAMLLDVTGGDMGETLRTAVTADSKVTVGFLSVPVGPALALLERVLQGPRLGGSLHRDGDELVLTAQLRVRSGQRTWRLEEPAGDESHALSLLARRLAGMVTAHLLHGPTLGREAIDHFHAGLQHYADAQRQPARRPSCLRKARDEFLRAAASDPAFGWASFNLGLVYHEQAVDTGDQLLFAGAELCFDRAIQTDPRRWEFRHARCVVARDQNDEREGVQHGQEALRLATSPLAKAKSAYQLGLLAGRGERSSDAAVLRLRRRAAAWARRALLAADLRDQDEADVLATGASTLHNLGVACAYRALAASGADRRRWTNLSRRSLGQAGALRPDDANLAFELAKVEDALGTVERTQRAARRTTAIDQEHLRGWIYAAKAATALGQPEELQRCLEALLWSPCRTLASPAPGLPPPLAELTQAWRELWPSLPPPTVPVRYLEDVMARWASLASLSEAELEQRIASPDDPGPFAPDLRRWEQAMAHLRLAEAVFRPPEATETEELDRVAGRLLAATDLLTDGTGLDHAADVVYLGLRPSVAHLRRRAFWLDSGTYGTQLFAARDLVQAATRQAPFDATAHAQLALVQLDLNNPAAAEEAFRAALDCRGTGDVVRWSGIDPLPSLPRCATTSTADLTAKLAGVLLVQANRAKADERSALRRRALALLDDVADDADTIEQAWPVLFRLGVARRDSFDYRGAMEAFALAWQANREPALCALLAAESAFSSDLHPTAVQWADRAIETADLLVAQGLHEQLGFDVEFGLSPTDIKAFAAWIKGRVALQRDEPLAAYRLARQTIRLASASNVAASAGYSLAGESRLRWSQRQDTNRLRHLEQAIAAYRRAETIDLDAELAEREATVLAELAELSFEPRRAAMLRDQARQLLDLAERLDLEERRSPDRARVAARLGAATGPTTNGDAPS